MVLIVPKYPVPVFRLFLRMGGWFVIITGVMLVLFSLISQTNLKTAKRFETEGRSAVAQIVKKQKGIRYDSDGRRRNSYWLTLEFVTDLGEQISVRRSVGKGQYQSVQEGGKQNLYYLTSDPRKIELSQGSHQKGARVTQWIALIVGVGWLTALWIIGGGAVSAVRARRFGAREEAMVQEVMQTGVKINSQPRYRLVWRDARGREGKSLLHKRSELGDLRPGDHINIYQGLKKSWWVGDIGERSEFTS